MKRLTFLFLFFVGFGVSFAAKLPDVVLWTSSHGRILSGGYKETLAVINPSAFYTMDVFANGKCVASIGPGGKVTANIKLIFSELRVVLVINVLDINGNIVGIASDIKRISPNNPCVWAVDRFTRLNGETERICSRSLYPSAGPINSQGEAGCIPQLKFASDIAVGFVNSSLFTVVARIDGEADIVIPSAENVFLRFRTIGSGTKNIQLFLCGYSGEVVGVCERRIYYSQSQTFPSVFLFHLTPQNFR